MADVFTRVHQEMQERLVQVEAEVAAAAERIAEKTRIEDALAALPPAVAAPVAPAREPARPARARKPKVRAPRGANRAAVHAALEMMPGGSAGEIAAAARVGRPQVAALLRAGIEAGEIRSVELASGQPGYQLIRVVETAFPATAHAGSTSAPTATAEAVRETPADEGG